MPKVHPNADQKTAIAFLDHVLARPPFRVEVIQTDNGAEEFYRLLEGLVIDDSRTFDDRLREREDYYNYHRARGSLGGQAPHERLRQQTTAATQA